MTTLPRERSVFLAFARSGATPLMNEETAAWLDEPALTAEEFRAQLHGLAHFDDVFMKLSVDDIPKDDIKLYLTRGDNYGLVRLPVYAGGSQLYWRPTGAKLADIDADGYVVPTRRGVLLGYTKFWAHRYPRSRTLLILSGAYVQSDIGIRTIDGRDLSFPAMEECYRLTYATRDGQHVSYLM